MANDDFLYAPTDTALESEGFTETKLKATEEGKKAIDQSMIPIERGLRKLTLNGGEGQQGVALVGDSIMTVEETVALSIAKSMIEAAERRTNKPLKELSLVELNFNSHLYVKGRACTEAQVLAEIGRLQNKEIYGDSVRRR